MENYNKFYTYESEKNMRVNSIKEQIMENNKRVKKMMQFGYNKERRQRSQMEKWEKEKEKECELVLPKIRPKYMEQKYQIRYSDRGGAQRQKFLSQSRQKIKQFMKWSKEKRSILSLDLNKSDSPPSHYPYEEQGDKNLIKMKIYSKQLKYEHGAKFREREELRLNKSLCTILNEQQKSVSEQNIKKRNIFNIIKSQRLDKKKQDDSNVVSIMVKRKTQQSKSRQIILGRQYKSLEGIKLRHKSKQNNSKSEKLLKDYDYQVISKIRQKYKKMNKRNMEQFSNLLDLIRRKNQLRQTIQREELIRLNRKMNEDREFVRYEEEEKEMSRKVKTRRKQSGDLTGMQQGLVSTKRRFLPENLSLIQKSNSKEKQLNCSEQKLKSSRKNSISNLQSPRASKERDDFKKYVLILDNKRYQQNKDMKISIKNGKKLIINVNKENSKKFLQTKLLCSPWASETHTNILDEGFGNTTQYPKQKNEENTNQNS